MLKLARQEINVYGIQNKENMQVDNMDYMGYKQKKNSGKWNDNELIILRDSALSAIIQKNIEIQKIIEKTEENDNKRQLNFLLQMSALRDKIHILQTDKQFLQDQIQQLQTKLSTYETQYKIQKNNLLQQIGQYKDRIQLLENYTEDINIKCNDVVNQINQMYHELIAIRQENRELKFIINNGRNKEDGGNGNGNEDSRICQDQELTNKIQEKLSGLSYCLLRQSSINKNNRIQTCLMSNRYKELSQKQKTMQQIIYYETQQWSQNQDQRQSSIQSPHCLKTSLKSINLIENYSQKSKNNQDSQSQFTSKYFKYGCQNHYPLQYRNIYDSCQNIPQEPQQELVIATQQQQIYKKQQQMPSFLNLWQKSGYFIGGIFVGAMIMSKLC